MIKTGENQTEGKENDSIQESKTKAANQSFFMSAAVKTLLRWLVIDFEISGLYVVVWNC